MEGVLPSVFEIVDGLVEGAVVASEAIEISEAEVAALVAPEAPIGSELVPIGAEEASSEAGEAEMEVSEGEEELPKEPKARARAIKNRSKRKQTALIKANKAIVAKALGIKGSPSDAKIWEILANHFKK
jgi:hypothetical protein